MIVVMTAARIIIGHRSSGSLINIGPRYDMTFVSPNYLNLSVALQYLSSRLKADDETMPTVFADVSILFMGTYNQSHFRAFRTLHEPLLQPFQPVFSRTFSIPRRSYRTV